MSEVSKEELLGELAQVLEETRRQLEWMADSGIRVVKREQEGAPSFASPTISGGSNRSRPGFMEPPPARPAPSVPPPPRAAPPPSMPPPVRPPEPVRVAAPSVPPPVRPAAPLPVVVANDPVEKLKQIRDELGDCTRCKLSTTRKNIVYGQGNPEAEIVFVGEAPGEDEDLSGLAFVGRAGQLLTKMIEAMGYSREQVYICNINKCRPPGNRKPEPDEVAACRPFVERQIKAINPKVIVALGATATQALLKVDTPIGRLRNHWQTWEGYPVMPTFHPSYLLRAPDQKAGAWDDLKLVLNRLGRTPPARKGG